ncbi:zinc finger BED domain-containing protein RICESLEEPER 2-like [Papaver somniferum]|uniref:zinc finger BED domain-containing protein RICESLEEPER 2-like n=1 Tax=Papaver somniferum TaxID=3469 RepID=UPI000E6FFA1E|nr:zinc finger BED domain-containing protein RICESLEEPER 2-like [Papaver somniferum]
MSSVQEQDHYNDVMSSDGEEDDNVEMLDSLNEDATVGCAPAPVSLGKKHKLRSQVWEFFKLVKYKDGTKKGVCKACNAGYKYESQKGGTSAMKRHKFPNRQSQDVGKMILSAKNGQVSTRVRKVDQMKLRDLFSALLIARNVPFSLVEWKEFRDICRICLTSDMWTSVTTTGYISLTAHYLDQDWVFENKLLNFCPLPPPHTALIVKEGLKKIDPAVLKIRLSVKSLKKSQVRKQKFLDIVDTLGMSGIKRGIRQDVNTRWNSTYLMLDSCILYKQVFSHLKLVDSDYEDYPTDEECEQIEVVTKFLKVFHDLTKIFSGSKYPTSIPYFERICQVQVLLKKESRNDIEFIRNMVKEMQAKFDSYWKELSPILAMAVVLDPRSKMNFVKFTYSKLYPEVRELEREVNKVRSNMTTLFNEYYTLSSSTASNSCATQNLGIQNGGNSAAEEGSDFFQEYVATQERGGDVLTELSELDEYLGESYRGCLNSPLDILNYWKNHEQRFPVLSIMAGDILLIPISTVASESAFSIGGRVIDRFRSSLLPENAEAFITTRNWEYGIGKEDMDENNEIIEEDVLGFEPDAVEDGAVEDGAVEDVEEVISYASN